MKFKTICLVFALAFVLLICCGTNAQESQVANVSMNNRTNFEVHIYWLDEDDNEQYYFSLNPGEKHVQQSYMGVFWIARDEEGNLLNKHEAKGDQTFLIGQPSGSNTAPTDNSDTSMQPFNTGSANPNASATETTAATPNTAGTAAAPLQRSRLPTRPQTMEPCSFLRLNPDQNNWFSIHRSPNFSSHLSPMDCSLHRKRGREIGLATRKWQSTVPA